MWTVVYKLVRARLIEDKLVTWSGTSRLTGHPDPDIGLLDIISIQVNSVFTLPRYFRTPLKKHHRPRLGLLTQNTQFSVDEFLADDWENRFGKSNPVVSWANRQLSGLNPCRCFMFEWVSMYGGKHFCLSINRGN